MTLKNNWVTGQTLAASDVNDIANAEIADAAAIAAIVSGATAAFVATAEATASTSYVDLVTTTDQVTVTVGSSGKAVVMFSAFVTSGSSSTVGYVSFALSGSNTAAADDSLSINFRNYSTVTIVAQAGNCFLLTGLTAGSTTFKLKYKSNGAAATFTNRRLAVIPFP